MAGADVHYGDRSVASHGESGNRVFFSMGKTINIGDYETIRVDVGEARTVEDGKKFGPAHARVRRNVQKLLKQIVQMVEESVE
jgi:hypothetical protein